MNSDEKSKGEEIGLPKCTFAFNFSHFKQLYKGSPCGQKHEKRKANIRFNGQDHYQVKFNLT